MNNFTEILEKLDNYIHFIELDVDGNIVESIFKEIDRYNAILISLGLKYDSDILYFKSAVRNIFKNTYNGNYLVAFDTMRELLDKFEDKLYIHDMKSENSINIYNNVNEHLYKGRVAHWSEKMTRKDMFHIPFNRRKYIATQRFSIPGVPCIYLGQSIYAVWEELERPQFDKLFVSRFKIDQDLTILDLGFSASDMIHYFESKFADEMEITVVPKAVIVGITDEELIEKLIITNLFKIACSVNVNDKERSFKSEYIFPQLMLSVILNCKIADGVRYNSVKVKNDSYIYMNYAFPSLTNDDYVLDSSQYDEILYSSKLVEKIQLTQPVNLGIYETIEGGGLPANSIYPENYFRRTSKYNIIDEYERAYQSTKFFRTEEKIVKDRGLTFKSIL